MAGCITICTNTHPPNNINFDMFVCKNKNEIYLDNFCGSLNTIGIKLKVHIIQIQIKFLLVQYHDPAMLWYNCACNRIYFRHRKPTEQKACVHWNSVCIYITLWQAQFVRTTTIALGIKFTCKFHRMTCKWRFSSWNANASADCNNCIMKHMPRRVSVLLTFALMAYEYDSISFGLSQMQSINLCVSHWFLGDWREAHFNCMNTVNTYRHIWTVIVHWSVCLTFIRMRLTCSNVPVFIHFIKS